MRIKTIIKMATAIVLMAACQQAAIVDSELENNEADSLGIAKADRIQIDNMPAGFPAEQDLAVIYPLWTEKGIRGATPTTNGNVLLSEGWLQQVSDAYADTDVADALEVENFYEQWRVVGLRFVPCGPLGIRPDQNIRQLCWPQVRLVWQPIVTDIMVAAMNNEYYADDRAIHALYHVSPTGSGTDPLLQQMKEYLGQGGNPDQIPRDFLRRFVEKRNEAINRLINGVAKLRSPGLENEFNQLDIRRELNTHDTTMSDAFEQRLATLLGALCEPENLFEMTSFSLPEGRIPALLNLWVFVAFEGANGRITQKPIEVIGRHSGQVIGHAGMSEAVGMVMTPDPELEEDLNNPEFAAELKDSVAFDREDLARLEPVINDPEKTLVPNTACSGCHSYNNIRFDFHAMSHLEHREATIAPRVRADLKNDLSWLRRELGQ